MNKLKLTGFISAIMLMLTITSCKKDKYQPIGDYGNANITHDNTITLNNFSEVSNDGTNFEFKTSVLWGEVTDDVYNNGIVLGYLKVGSEWYALPYGQDESTYSINYNFSLEVGVINVYVQGWATVPIVASDFNGDTFRFVIITEETRMANLNVDLTNYEEVKMAFNLKD